MTRPPRRDPHDAVLLLAFGGPVRPGDVRPFLDNVLRGKPVPRERYEEVVRHYEEVGGASPLNRLTFAQAEALRDLLARAGPALPVYVGMRHWEPFIAETLAAMAREGRRRAVGIVLAAHRSPASWEAYLTAVAKYQVASALRGAPGPDDGAQSIDSITTEIASPLDDPANTLSQLELLEALRECLAQLGDDDRTLATQLTAITERRWRDAAAALGMSESTLRSRWKRTLDRLRECVEAKTGLTIAPKPSDDDS